MKNSEWGACAYLGKSQYGLGNTEIAINNVTLNSGSTARTSDNGKTGVESVYAVTGVTSGNANSEPNIIDKSVAKECAVNISNAIRDTAVNGAYAWNQSSGIASSTTGTIYGVYDMSGGTWERTAAYINTPNDNENLSGYGSSVVNDKNERKAISTKYTTIYPHGEEDTSNIDTSSETNWIENKNTKKIYGDAVLETSTQGTGFYSWNNDYSYYPALDNPFFHRGGYWSDCGFTGAFAFYYDYGGSYYNIGFRTVLVVV